MTEYRIVVWYSNRRRVIKIQANTPLEALKKFKENMAYLAYVKVQIKEIA
jgi:hypothetical protein